MKKSKQIIRFTPRALPKQKHGVTLWQLPGGYAWVPNHLLELQEDGTFRVKDPAKPS